MIVNIPPPKTKHLRYLFLLLAVLATKGAEAQARFSFESTLHLGSIWRHTPKLTTRTGQPLWGQEIGLRFQTTGRRDWHQWQRYPALGVSLLHFRLGSGSHGDGFGLLPNLSIPIFRTGWFMAAFRLGTGLAWVTEPYDYFDNPGENAIGSHWNNITQFRLGGELRVSDFLRLNAGAALTHFSNGGASLPNFGINLPSGFVGVAWSPKPIREKDFLAAKTSKRAERRRLGGTVQAGLAILEYAVYDGPKYPVWLGAAAGYFQVNKANRVLLGVDYEFNKAIFNYGLHLGEFANETEAGQGATRLAVFLADEFLFGNIGIQLQMGRYIGKDFNRYTPERNYSKLTIRCYTPRLFRSAMQPHIGITLKAHATTAEYISTNVGLAF